MEKSLRTLLFRQILIFLCMLAIGAWLYQAETRYNAYYVQCLRSRWQAPNCQFSFLGQYFHYFTESHLVNFLFFGYSVYLWVSLVIRPWQRPL